MVAQPLLSQVCFVCWSTVLHKKKRFITHQSLHLSDQTRENNIAIISSLDWITNDENRRRHPMSCDCGVAVTVMIRASKFLKLWHSFAFFNPKTFVMSITTMIRTKSSWISPNKLLQQKRSPMSMTLTECKPCNAIHFCHSRTPATN